MNVWNLVEPKKLVKTETPLPESREGMLRVRVTKVLLNSQDAAIYAGDARVKYPLVPGRFAVGFVSEDGEADALPKGTRVLLHGYRPVPQEGVEKRDFSADDFYACGRTVDGFLRDFVLVSPDDMTALPASVSDERGLLLHHIAAAKEICDKLGAQKGQHVAVVGADLIGILVCQLLIYQQAAPILVDADKKKLDFARECGVYYAFPNDRNIVDTVASVTGGGLAAGAVHIATATGNASELAFSLCKRDGRVVYYAASTTRLILNMELALRKHLSVACVSHGVKYLKTAINLVANKAVDPTAFRANCVKAQFAEELLANYFARTDRDVNELCYVDLLQ